MLRRIYVIECINKLFNNKANRIHSRHRSVDNFIMNVCLALAVYCLTEIKPELLPVHIENTQQLEYF